MDASWKELPTTGFKMPPDFPIDSYLLVNSNIEKCKLNFQEQCMSFNLGWRGIAYRFRASCEYGEQFTSSIIKYSGGPPHEERYNQEKYLLGFFVNAISTLECFFFSTYCLASIVKSKEFPVKAASDLRFYSADVVKKFNNYFSSDSLTTKQCNCLDHSIYKKMKDMRDVLSHRGVTSRTFYHGGVRDGIATMPENIKAPSDQWLFDFRLDQLMTSSYLTWLSTTLKELIEATGSFCKDNL